MKQVNILDSDLEKVETLAEMLHLPVEDALSDIIDNGIWDYMDAWNVDEQEFNDRLEGRI